jgi:hypothetical protein
MDLDITMNFLAGSTFIFGSWIYTADDSDKFQGHLVEISMDQATPVTRQDALEDLVEKISKFSFFNPTQTQNHLKQFESYSNTTRFSKKAPKPSANHGPHLA